MSIEYKPLGTVAEIRYSGGYVTQSTTRGLARALRNETVISDLIQHLSDLDFRPWQALVGLKEGRADRELLLSKNAGRADLVLFDEMGNVKALLEVKVAHSFDDKQRAKYESWTESRDCQRLLLTVEPDNYRIAGWQSLSLAHVFSAWSESSVLEARTLALHVVGILAGWEESLRRSMLPVTDDGASTISAIQDPFVKRILTRTMQKHLLARDREAYAGVTSGGGIALVQAWCPIQDQPEGNWFIAEARLETVPKIRFGVETSDDNAAGRQLIFDIANSLDDAIRVDYLQKHLHAKDLSSMAEALEAVNQPGSGRPAPRGDWSVAIKTGKVAPGTGPGFHRDRATRLEAMAQLDHEQATALDVEHLLDTILTYLTDQWREVTLSGAFPTR